MNAVFVLLALSTIVGLVLGFRFSLIAILVSGVVLAFLSAAVLQHEGFGFLAGTAIIVICVTVNQVSYMIALRLSNKSRTNRECRTRRQNAQTEA